MDGWKTVKNVEMLMLLKVKRGCDIQTQHWAFRPNDFLPWDIVQSWSSLWSLMRTERHPISTKTRTPTAGNDGKVFFFFCQMWGVIEVSLCEKNNNVELRNVNIQLSQGGFSCAQGRVMRRAEVHLCVIAINGFLVLIMGLQKDEKTRALSPRFIKMKKHWKALCSEY